MDLTSRKLMPKATREAKRISMLITYNNKSTKPAETHEKPNRAHRCRSRGLAQELQAIYAGKASGPWKFLEGGLKGGALKGASGRASG